jgi:hypothetical protein
VLCALISAGKRKWGRAGKEQLIFLVGIITRKKAFTIVVVAMVTGLSSVLVVKL